jgi:protein transport protein SEC61 subunit gamma-like protein
MVDVQFVNGIVQSLQGFYAQSQRVILVTHKPREKEFWHIAGATALGMAVIGVIGLIISMAAHYLRVS